MRHLQEMGLNLGETLLYWCRIHDNRPRAATRYGEWTLCKRHSHPTISTVGWEYVPTYTLQDVLELLPKNIGNEYIYELCVFTHSINYAQFIGGEINDILFEVPIDGNLIDAGYEMLCWCIGQGYVKINKESKQ